jgi:hypothetical protein
MNKRGGTVSFESIRKDLASDLVSSEDAKSSHWKFHTASLNLSSTYQVSGINGFSNRTNRFPGSTKLHKRNLKKLFPWGKAVINGNRFSRAIEICHLQSREIDTCVARHVFTFELLEEYEEIQRNLTCVIGDGQSNFVSQALVSNFSKKLISINLTEVLLSDLELIEKIPSVSADEISIARNASDVQNFLNTTGKKLLLVSAQNAECLFKAEIDLFINMASFQEMTPALVEKYFDIIESNNSYLYCCNRLEKKLYGGEVNRFMDFPWKNSKIMLDESCKWHQDFYSFRSVSFFKKLKFDGQIWHRLVKF